MHESFGILSRRRPQDWYYLGDTSSDSLDGHIASLALVYDVLVDAQPEHAHRALALIQGLVGGVVDNDYYLIDPETNAHTTWVRTVVFL